MSTIVIEIPPETYSRLEEHSRQVGKSPEVYARELLETALQTYQESQPRTTREVLRALGRVQPLSETLRRRIIPGVTLDEVREILAQTTGPALGDTILEERGSGL